MDFSIRLKDLRERNKLSQADLAKKIGVGVSTVGMWESTSRRPNAKTIQKLVALFHCSIGYLLGNEEDEEEKPLNFEELSESENELIFLYRKLPAEFQASLLETARIWTGTFDSIDQKKAKL